MYAIDLASGDLVWSKSLDVEVHINSLHGIQNRRPVLLKNQLLLEPFTVNTADGSFEKFWKFGRREGCGQISASSKSLYYRAESLSSYNLDRHQQTKVSTITRPGCWINCLPAGGVLLVPESSSGCECDYAIQTSMTFMPR